MKELETLNEFFRNYIQETNSGCSTTFGIENSKLYVFGDWNYLSALKKFIKEFGFSFIDIHNHSILAKGTFGPPWNSYFVFKIEIPLLGKWTYSKLNQNIINTKSNWKFVPQKLIKEDYKKGIFAKEINSNYVFIIETNKNFYRTLFIDQNILVRSRKVKYSEVSLYKIDNKKIKGLKRKFIKICFKEYVEI